MFPIPTRIEHPTNILLSIQTVAAVVSSVDHEFFTIIVQHKYYTSVIILSTASLRLITRH